MPEIKDHIFACDKCGKGIVTQWMDNEDGTTFGMIMTNKDHLLLGDAVFHVHCWDEIEKEHPEIFGDKNGVPV